MLGLLSTVNPQCDQNNVPILVSQILCPIDNVIYFIRKHGGLSLSTPQLERCQLAELIGVE